MIRSKVIVWVAAVGLVALTGAAPVPRAVVRSASASASASPVHAAPSVQRRSVNNHLRLPAAGGASKTTVRAGGTSSSGAQATRVKLRTRGAKKSVTRARRVVSHKSGSIRGTVAASGEQSTTGARVALQGPKGKKFRKPGLRHVTYVNSSGGFLMRNVKAGSYRVVATKSGVGSGHAQVGLKAGATQHVHVQLASASKKRK
jgi:hypothetical protein